MPNPISVDDFLDLVSRTPPETHLQLLKMYLHGIKEGESKDVLTEFLLANINKSAPKEKKQIYILIHGIRTAAIWHDRLEQLLREHSITEVKKLGYGFFDVIRFLIPFARKYPINKVYNDINQIISENPESNIDIIAHSFGTYIITRLIKKHSHFRFRRILLCGSIVSTDYEWHSLPNKPASVLNDVGTKDYLPVAAKLSTFGFGHSGTLGFRNGFVTDRYFEFGHSDFFTEDFMKSNWINYLVSGHIAASPPRKSSPPYLVLVASALPECAITLALLFILPIAVYFSN